MENQTFQWSRFLAALKKEVVENWRTLLFTTIGIYGILTFFMIIGNLTLGNETARPVIMLRYVVVYMVFSFGSVFVASLAFRGLTSKNGRIELLTSPSSTLEKFIVNALIYVLGFIVVFPICAQLADLTRFLILWPWSDGDVPAPINFMNTIHQFAFQQDFWELKSKVLFEISLWLGAFAAPGCYLLGSIIWPKLSFLKTIAALYVIEFVVSLLMIGGILLAVQFSDISNLREFAQWISENIQFSTFMLCIAIFAALQLVVYWTLSWWLWKRKDVISLKWWS